MDPTLLPAWRALETHTREMQALHMRDMFDADPARFERFHARAEGILFDYSKQRINQRTLELLLQLAREAGVREQAHAMMRGDAINTSEDRAVLHTALRRPESDVVTVAGENVMPAVHAVLARMRAFTRALHTGELRGATGERVTDIVNIGIGGSDLGPRMVSEALAPYAVAGVRTHFVANVDPRDLSRTLANLDARHTLFVVASKTFTTQETMANANAARDWLAHALGRDDATAQHFVALSTNEAAARAFGIDPARMFPFWDWVGGRYSLWSAVGLSIMLALGSEHFDALLAGAHAIDDHFLNADNGHNVPLLMALLGVWNSNFLGAHTHAILPYDQGLVHFARYFQQGDMESNGKSVTRDGTPVTTSTGPIVWGEVGTNGQHAFYQLLHQGTHWVPCDFLIAASSHHPLGVQHEMLVAHCFAQSQALMRGRTIAEARAELQASGVTGARLEALAAARTFPGNRPSSTLLYPRLTPRTLGALIALYEHKIFAQAAIWGINAFDQWGVELGKVLAGSILPALTEGREVAGLDASTAGLLNAAQALRRA